METSVGVSEAKTHLTRLLERVAKGESSTITKHGVPIALLVPHEESKRRNVAEVIERIRALRKGQTLGGITIKELIEEGRR